MTDTVNNSCLRILEFMLSKANENRVPSIREIVKQFGWKSTNHVNDCMKLLRKKGVIDYQGGQSRTYVSKYRMEILPEIVGQK